MPNPKNEASLYERGIVTDDDMVRYNKDPYGNGLVTDDDMVRYNKNTKNMPLYNAIGGVQPSPAMQPPPQAAPPAPMPPGMPGAGGPSMFQALQQQMPHQGGTQPLKLGPQVASNDAEFEQFLAAHPELQGSDRTVSRISFENSKSRSGQRDMQNKPQVAPSPYDNLAAHQGVGRR